jgi:hypothetical protein
VGVAGIADLHEAEARGDARGRDEYHPEPRLGEGAEQVALGLRLELEIVERARRREDEERHHHDRDGHGEAVVAPSVARMPAMIAGPSVKLSSIATASSAKATRRSSSFEKRCLQSVRVRRGDGRGEEPGERRAAGERGEGPLEANRGEDPGERERLHDAGDAQYGRGGRSGR